MYFISADDAANALSMKEAIDLMKDAFSQLSSGEANVPQRTRIEMTEKNASALFMPVYSPAVESYGVKTVSVFHDNPSRSLPTIHALVLLMDTRDGTPRAIIDGEYLTALRTGAASGLATDLLANRDAKTVAVFGAGAQGRTQLEAVCEVRNIDQCFIFEPNRIQRERFESEMSARLDIGFTISSSIRELSQAEIICTATNSRDPVFEDSYVKEGCHINAIGAYTPQMIEIPIETVKRAKIVVDQRSACLAESGDLLNAIEAGEMSAGDIHAELGEIVDEMKPGRLTATEITLFESVGNAVQDLVCANRILENAIAKNIGTKLNL
jgi:ornithine cyclodeaminase/alanine dehydrogenase-like protein (mu-crystallin family)